MAVISVNLCERLLVPGSGWQAEAFRSVGGQRRGGGWCICQAVSVTRPDIKKTDQRVQVIPHEDVGRRGCTIRLRSISNSASMCSPVAFSRYLSPGQLILAFVGASELDGGL